MDTPFSRQKGLAYQPFQEVSRALPVCMLASLSLARNDKKAVGGDAIRQPSADQLFLSGRKNGGPEDIPLEHRFGLHFIYVLAAGPAASTERGFQLAFRDHHIYSIPRPSLVLVFLLY